MRTAARSAVLLLTLLVAACAQVEPVILVVSMPECTYQGPVTMNEGEAQLSLTLNGLGDVRVMLVELEAGHAYGDLEEHFEMSDQDPDWVRRVIDLGLNDAEGVEGRAGRSRLGEGEYAVVCIDQNTGNTSLASPLRVQRLVSGSEIDRGRSRGR